MAQTCQVCQRRAATRVSHRRASDAHWTCFAQYRKESLPRLELPPGTRRMLDVYEFLEHRTYVIVPESAELPRGQWKPRAHVLTRDGAPVQTLIGGDLHSSRGGADEIAVNVARGWIELHALRGEDRPDNAPQRDRTPRPAPLRPHRGLWSSPLTPRGTDVALYATA